MKTRKIHKDDTVIVLAGKDKGKTGKVKKIFKNKDLLLVENVNMVKRHVKPNPYKNEQGGIVDKEAPLHVSNVQLICESCTKPTRVGYKIADGGKKVRYCKKCNEVMS
ncbi:50S ribosomal protein L24 [Desulfoplanes formicivorans]|jgi:large subunit ribosomal protein L24|uniref:Large ribosomal subunit protein uL24 n=1 Tax=Desulfoplanes formicivorans TaxID=1592317 RepID=A0A194ABJ1_9BACT|nr:50S ribosomal protein L24 [Desulfoplanes formicivorans]GAU07532.1 50S ribosomal protein L24 [Desulfoplanes formicivorans]